jgi:hypothetical protein
VMQVFDSMVDDLRSGDTLIANYDSSLSIQLNYESLTVSDDENSITVADDNILQMLRAFMEVYVTAREEPLDLNYDLLLNGF